MNFGTLKHVSFLKRHHAFSIIFIENVYKLSSILLINSNANNLVNTTPTFIQNRSNILATRPVEPSQANAGKATFQHFRPCREKPADAHQAHLLMLNPPGVHNI